MDSIAVSRDQWFIIIEKVDPWRSKDNPRRDEPAIYILESQNTLMTSLLYKNKNFLNQYNNTPMFRNN